MGLFTFKRDYYWLLFILLGAWFVFRFSPKGFYDLGGDSAHYIIVAESLSKGGGLHMPNYPGNPGSFYFAPVLSFLLAPILYFFGRNFYLMHLMLACISFLSLFFFYRIFKILADKKTAVLATLFFGTGWVFLLYATQYILSEAPYVFFSGFAMLMSLRLFEKEEDFRKEGLFTSAGLILSYFSRYTAVILYVSIVFSLLSSPGKNRFKKIALISAPFLFFVVAWNALQALSKNILPSHIQLFFLADGYLPDKGSWLTHPGFMAVRFIENANRLWSLLGESSFFYFAGKNTFLSGFLGGVATLLTFLGLWLKIKERKCCIMHYYFLFYILLILFWSSGSISEGARYMFPVLPFVYFYIFSALSRISSRLPGKRHSAYSLVCVSILFFLNFSNTFLITKSFPWSFKSLPAPLKNYVILCDWIKTNLSGEDLILSRKPSITYFYSGHKSVLYPYTADSKKIWQEALQQHVKYIIIDEFSIETYRFLLPALNSHVRELEILKCVGGACILKIKGLK